MAGVWIEHVNGPQLLTLPCQPSRQCAQIHNRMPLLKQPEAVDFWLNATAGQVQSKMQPLEGDIITI
jgi:putative SOS response-associated peptidase YedK